MRNLTILGSTGSIGTSTLDIIHEHPHAFSIETLTAGSNAAALAKQAIAFGAKRAVIADESCYGELKSLLASHPSIRVEAGEEALISAAAESTDMVMAAIVGIAGLRPIHAAARAGVTILLANKEALICGGRVLLDVAKNAGATILPVDSEHNAIFQALEGSSIREVEKITLTASGGPFRSWSLDQMEEATLDQALNHPNWDMGAKVTIDSATMVNKGLELMEAHYLFGLGGDQLDVVIHPESIIHSLVAYVDGSSLAQMSVPDMRVPIAHCLGYPARIATTAQRLDLIALSKLHFEAPDYTRFPALRMAKEILASDAALSIIYNAANEVAVSAFMEGKIRYVDIARTIEDALSRHPQVKPATVSDIFDIDHEVKSSLELYTP